MADTLFLREASKSPYRTLEQMQMERCDGETTRQMQAAPKGSLFVWVNGSTHYARDLAHRLDRDDLVIVSPSYFEGDRWRGFEWPGIVLDHACRLTERQRDGYRNALALVRS